MRLLNLSDEEFVKTVNSRVDAMFDHWGDWHKQARKTYDFIAGKMWSDEDQEHMESEGKVPVAFNRAGAILDAVIGLFISNPQDIRCFPRTLGAAQVNEILTAAIDQARDNAFSQHEENDAARDMLAIGVGVIETTINYDLNPQGDLVQPRCDPLEFAWDPSSNRQNFSDARDMVRKRAISKEAYADLWPTADEGEGRSGGSVGGEGPVLVTNKDRYKSGAKSSDKIGEDEVEITHYQWFESVTTYRVLHATGQDGQADFAELSPEEFASVADRMSEMNAPLEQGKHFMRRSHKVAMQAFLCGDRLLEKGPCPCPFSFTFKMMTGKRDHNAGHWYGLGRLLKDPQMWFNKLLSEIIHIMANNSNGGGLIAEEGAFVDEKAAQDDWSNPSKIVYLRRGFLSKVMPKTPAPYPIGMDKIMLMSGQMMRDVTGVNLELMGLADRDQPGVLEYQRKQAALGTLSDMLASVRRYRKEVGEVLVHLVTTFLADGRLIRVAADTGPQYVQLLKDQDTLQYEVIVDDAPTSPNEKERVSVVLQQLLPMALQAGIMPPPEILDYLPLPTGLVEKWKMMLMNQTQQPSPEQQKAEAQVAALQQKAQIDQQKAGIDMQAKQADLAVKQRTAELDAVMQAHKLEMERQMAELKLMVEAQKAQIDLMALRQKTAAQAEATDVKVDSVVRTTQAKTDAKIKEHKAMAAAKARQAAIDSRVKSQQRKP